MRVPSAESGQRCQQLYGNDAGAAEVALGHGLEHFKEMVTWAKFITVRTGCDPKKRVGTPEMTWSDDDTCVFSYLKSERGRKPEKYGRV